MQINLFSKAIHQDFFTMSGTDFTADAEIVFEKDGDKISLGPDFIRPHLALVAQLPSTLPTGTYNLSLQSSTSMSNILSVEVSDLPRISNRILHSGAQKPDPYTIVFVANRATVKEDGSLKADPMLQDRDRFHALVVHCFRNLFAVEEDLLRIDNVDEQIRTVSIFDDALDVSDDNALAHEVGPNLMETRRTKLAPFLAQYNVTADFVFVLHGSTSHTRATAWYTSDDANRPGTSYTYDGQDRTHGHFPRIPGSAAISLAVDTTGLTVIHEFGHGASDFNNGRVNDLYQDGSPLGFIINKKWRASAADEIPAQFATYNGEVFSSALSRGNLSYPATWESYHPELIDGSRPNLMDNYWQADDPQLCRFDQSTYRWFRDRLQAKLSR